MQAIILAGGKGTRLKPFTTNIPKPLVPIDDLPILTVILKQLKHFGFTDIVIAVNHLAELIMAFYGNGEKLGLNIKYSLEETPLGTAGPISLIDKLDDNFLVMNGDVLTTLDFGKLFNFHLQEKSLATITSYKKEVKIDLGVLITEENQFVDYIEKPTYKYDVSTGIYCMNKKVLDYMPHNEKYDLPQLMLNLKAKEKKVSIFTDNYYWLDIGRIDDFEEANNIFTKRKSEFLYEE